MDESRRGAGCVALFVAPSSFSEEKKTLKIALVAKSSTNPSFSRPYGAEARLGSFPPTQHQHRHRLAHAPTEDGQVQAQRIAQAVNEGADAVLVSCSDAARSPAPSRRRGARRSRDDL